MDSLIFMVRVTTRWSELSGPFEVVTVLTADRNFLRMLIWSIVRPFPRVPWYVGSVPFSRLVETLKSIQVSRKFIRSSDDSSVFLLSIEPEGLRESHRPCAMTAFISPMIIIPPLQLAVSSSRCSKKSWRTSGG